MRRRTAGLAAGALAAVLAVGCLSGGEGDYKCEEVEDLIYCAENWIGVLQQSCPDEHGAVETSFRFDRAGIADTLRAYHGVLGNVLIDSIQKGDWLYDSSQACVQGECEGESRSIEVQGVPPEPVWGLFRHRNPVGALIDSGPIFLEVSKAAQCP